MINKQDFLKTIYDNDAMKAAMSQLKTKSELESTKAIVEEVLGEFYDHVFSIASYAQINAEDIKKAVIEKDKNVIMDNSSKSTDDEQKD